MSLNLLKKEFTEKKIVKNESFNFFEHSLNNQVSNEHILTDYIKQKDVISFITNHFDVNSDATHFNFRWATTIKSFVEIGSATPSPFKRFPGP